MAETVVVVSGSAPIRSDGVGLVPAGAPVVAAVSAPTAAGVRLAGACGITLVAVARGQDFEVFTHHQRIIGRAAHHVA